MKKIILLLLFTTGCTFVYSQQQIKIVSFSVKNTLPANIDNWGSEPGAIIMVAQNPPGSRFSGMNLIISIKSGGSIVCSNNTTGGLKVDDFTTRTFSAAELTNTLAGCNVLKEGSYTLCVQFFNGERKEISTEMCKPFNVEAPKSSNYAPPTLISPNNGKEFTEAELRRPVTFRWTPLVPKPRDNVTYRLRVWQLMQGQNSTQAMRSNQPIVTKDVDNVTQTVVSNIYNGPCKPPYICEFVWTVDAIMKQATGDETVVGTSSPYMFVVSQYIIQLDSIKVNCTNTPGIYSFSYTITNPNVGPATLNLFTATSSVPAGASVTSFSPPLNTVINAGNQLTITGTITGSPNLTNICIGAEIRDVTNLFWKASKDTCIKVEPCKCDVCEKVKIDIVQKELKFDQNGNIILSTNISSSPKPVKSIKAELVYYEYKPENDDCMVCNKDSKTFGNFINGTHTTDWNFAPPKNIANGTPLQMAITVPPTVTCCNATFRWCIRYVITFDDCTVCNKLVCYEIKKVGCPVQHTDPVNNPK